MSERIKRNLQFLRAFLPNPKKKKQRRAILKLASSDNIKALCEGALNTLKGNVPLSVLEKRKLRRHSEKIRKLACRKTSVKRKKAFLVQEGGFLPLIITPLLSAAGGLAARAIANAAGL